MGEVLQFRRRARAIACRGYCLVVKPENEKFGHFDRDWYRIAPDLDGTVVLELKTAEGATRLTLSVEDAEMLRQDLSRVAYLAEGQRKRLRGANKWRCKPVEGKDAYEVCFNDGRATFVATKIRKMRGCELCRADMPAGSIMYRQEGRSMQRWRGGPREMPAGSLLIDMDRRVCRACMTPNARD